jgi:uncharacterized protein YjbI with pentapeptide repeats
MKIGLERAFAVIGASTVLVLGFDSLTYAATGSSLILGSLNKSHRVTTVQNTGSGPALRLVTKSSASPPFVTNSRGKVANLNADQLDGLSAPQIRRRSVTRCAGYPHQGIDWSIPGSTPGHGCSLFGAKIVNMVLTNANMANVVLTNADVTDSALSGANLRGASAFRLNANGASLRNANLRGANLSQATLFGADLSGANLTNANLSFANLDSADLSNAVTKGITLTSANFNNTTCPDGTNSDTDGDTCFGHL